MKTVLTRLRDDGRQTLGIFQVFNGLMKIFECKTLELPYLNNKKNISCIPPGEYFVRKHDSPMFGKVFHVFEVPGRSEILIHKGNYSSSDTEGCILVGKEFIDINLDGTTDISSSTQTMQNMLSSLPEEFKMIII